MNSTEMISVILGCEAGKKVEKRGFGASDQWERIHGKPTWNFAAYEFRLEPAPEPKRMVPLGPGDINLHRDLFRYGDGGSGERQIASGMNSAGICVGSAHVATSWALAKDTLKRSTDGGQTWTACEKEEA